MNLLNKLQYLYRRGQSILILIGWSRSGVFSGVLSLYWSEDNERAQHGSPAYEDVLDEVESEALQAEYQDMA